MAKIIEYYSIESFVLFFLVKQLHVLEIHVWYHGIPCTQFYVCFYLTLHYRCYCYIDVYTRESRHRQVEQLICGNSAKEYEK